MGNFRLSRTYDNKEFLEYKFILCTTANVPSSGSNTKSPGTCSGSETCEVKCHYCDFNSSTGLQSKMRPYTSTYGSRETSVDRILNVLIQRRIDTGVNTQEASDIGSSQLYCITTDFVNIP